MRQIVLGLSLLFFSAAVSAGEAVPEAFESKDFRAHGNDPRYQKIRDLFTLEERGIELYRVKDFLGAYEALEVPAANGLKTAQGIMALMVLRGEGTEKHPLKGVALLGLAAESGDRGTRRQYRQALDKVPKQFRETVEAQVQVYIERYGMEAQGITCKRTRRPQSHFTVMDCSKQLGDYEVLPWVP